LRRFTFILHVPMAKKKSFVLRIDPETFKAIEKWAADEFRSTNGQIEWMLHKMLLEANRLKKQKENEQEEDT